MVIPLQGQSKVEGRITSLGVESILMSHPRQSLGANPPLKIEDVITSRPHREGLLNLL